MGHGDNGFSDIQLFDEGSNREKVRRLEAKSKAEHLLANVAILCALFVEFQNLQAHFASRKLCFPIPLGSRCADSVGPGSAFPLAGFGPE